MNKAYFDDVAVHGLEWQAPHVYRVPGLADIVAAEGAHSGTAHAAFEYLYIPIMKKGRSFLTSLHHFTEIAFNKSVPLKYKTILHNDENAYYFDKMLYHVQQAKICLCFLPSQYTTNFFFYQNCRIYANTHHTLAFPFYISVNYNITNHIPSLQFLKSWKFNYKIKHTTRVSVETGSSTGLFLFIYLQTFKSQKDINWSCWMISNVNESKSLMYALLMVLKRDFIWKR